MDRGTAETIIRSVFEEFMNRSRLNLEFRMDAKISGREGVFDSLTVAEFILAIQERTGTAVLDEILSASSLRDTTFGDVVEMVAKG